MRFLLALLFSTVLFAQDPNWLNLYGLGNSSSLLNGATTVQTHGSGVSLEIQWREGWQQDKSIFWPFFEFRSYSESANGGPATDWKGWNVGTRYYPNLKGFKFNEIRLGFIGAVGRLDVTNDATVASSGQGRVGLRLDRISPLDPTSGSFAEMGFINDPRLGKAGRFYLMGRYIVLGNKNLQVFLEPRTTFHMTSGQHDEFSLFYGVKIPISKLLE